MTPRVPLDDLTLAAIQGASFRVAIRHPDIHHDKVDLAVLAEQIGRVASAGRTAHQMLDESGLVGALLDLAALAALWVEQLEHDREATRLHDPALVYAVELAARADALRLVDDMLGVDPADGCRAPAEQTPEQSVHCGRNVVPGTTRCPDHAEVA